MEKLISIMSNSASNIVESNAAIILNDLAKQAAEEGGSNKLDVKVTVRLTKMGSEYLVEPIIEWKKEMKHKDTMDAISYNPDQPELFE